MVMMSTNEFEVLYLPKDLGKECVGLHLGTSFKVVAAAKKTLRNS